MEENEIILVDEADNDIGYKSKKECHYIEPKLHRAFSVFLFTKDGKMIITKRSDKKETWPGFWTNTCCSHPNKDEDMFDAVKRRLDQELGIQCRTKFVFKFQYEAMYDEIWGEKEIDWVFIGTYDGDIKADSKEIGDVKYISREDLLLDMSKNPDNYTPWFKESVERVFGVIDGKETNSF